MASNLRVKFCKRQCKHLSKSIVINPSPSKKTYPELAPDPSSKSTSPTTITVVTSGPNEKPSSIDDISYHKRRKPFVILGEISKDSFKCLNSSPFRPRATYVSVKLLNHIPSFTEREPPVPNMGVDENLNQSFMARLPYGTSDITIAHIIHLNRSSPPFSFVTCLIFSLVFCLIMIFIAPRW
ncbi:hypothetical protein PVL29_002381 [Vitis rotundifolia]|uniref:Uncharacterized protein n=1 Tax=Vitis rotundifolia TaxID=103349 RepID=A0AA39AJG1_VITRO|nr:hypothetical protein PVL29_002381 [Vitis rotundifolia]